MKLYKRSNLYSFLSSLVVTAIFVSVVFPSLEPMYAKAAPGDWTTGMSSPSVRARAYHTSVVYNGKIYSFGGQDYATNATNTLDIYDIVGNSWSVGANNSTEKDYSSSVVYNGNMYVFGGWDGVGNHTNSLDVYDIGLDSWTASTSGGIARAGHTSTLYNGKMYVWGGYDENNNATNTLDILDIESATWSTGEAGGTARAYHSAATYNGKIYFWAGDDDSSYVNSLDIYDIGDDSWSTGTAGGTARGYASAVVYGDKIYFWGGDDGSVYLDTMYIYDIGDDSWSLGNPASGYARVGHSSILYGDKIYSYGGDDDINILNDMLIYEIGSNSSGVESQITTKQQILSELSMTVASTSITMLPAIPGLTGGAGYGETDVNIVTNNTTGYTVTLSASSTGGTMVGDVIGYAIPAYSPTDGIPTTWASSTSGGTALFGFAVEAVSSETESGSLWNSKNDNLYFTSATSGPITILKRNTHTTYAGATSTLHFRVEVPPNPNPAVPEDWYTATTTLTATMN